jgi:hemolysin III
MAGPFPDFDPAERVADGVIHVVGVSAGAVGSAVLLAVGLPGAGVATAVSLPLYAAGLLAMLTFSALYNLTRHPERKERLRRFDHAAIFVMIAGSYTPFALVKIGGGWGIGLLVFVWVLAILGVVLKLTRPRRGDGLSIVLYLVMGWSVVVAVVPLVEAVAPPVFVLLVAGGVIYTVGVGVHLLRRLRFHNAVWHLCVLIAAGCHYAAVFAAVALPGGLS